MSAATPTKSRSPGRPRGGKAAVAGFNYQAALSALPDDLRAETLKLSSEIDQLGEDDIRRRHELGLRLVSIRDNTTGRYGDDPIKQMTNVMPLSKDGIRLMINLAEAYTTPELDQFMVFRHPVTTERLTWTHVATLARIKDKTKRVRLAEQAVAEGWTSRDLNRRIIQSHGGPRSKGGRKSKRPGSFRDAVTDITARSATWENAADDIWLAPGGLVDLYETQAAALGYRPDQAVADSLDAARSRLVGMQLKLVGLLQQVDNLKHRVDAARAVRTVA